MVWDTLFALDEKLQVKPQMVDKWDVSPDKLTWTFTLRDGLEWNDGTPVTAEDCIASIKRWGARDSMGQKMLASVADFEAVDAKTFKMKMKEPYGLVLESLGKPSSNVPFMMPKRVAETDPFTQIKAEDVIGSGPFIFIAKEWKPGEKIVFVKNPNYKPRAEPPSGLAGGKVAKVDRVEWIWIPDAQTQVAALQSGEIDMLEQPPPRPAAAAGQGQEHQAVQRQSARQPVRASASTRCSSRSTIPRSATPRWSPSTRRTSSRPRSAIRSTTRSARRCSSAARRWPATRAWPTC